MPICNQKALQQRAHSFVVKWAHPHKMVTKMNEPATTVIETLSTVQQQQQHPTSAVVTITLHPQPNANERENNCDNISSITSDTTTALSNVSPSSCESDTIERSQAIIKKSLKLDLTHSNNDKIEEDDDAINRRDNDEDVIESPTEKEDLSFKSPTSPKSPRGGNGKKLLHYI